MNILQSLSKFGLEERQAELYMFLLKHSKGAGLTAFNIAKNIDIPRSTVYLTLQELEAKKLVSSYKKDNVLHYLTADPIRLARDVEEKQELLGSLIPALKALTEDTVYSPSVQTYTGENGVRTVFDDIFDNPHLKGIREFHTISNPKLIKYLSGGNYFGKKMGYKKELNIPTKMLISDTYKDDVPKEYQSDTHRATRFLPIELAFEGTLIIYGKKSALFSHRDNEVYSMIIDSPAISEMLDSIFLCLWNLVPKS